MEAQQDRSRAFNARLHALGALDPMTDFDPVKRASIRVNVDSLHRIRPARRDSISNGADDDGSGTVGLLEIAEAWVNASGTDRPRRSVLFVWHVGEEVGRRRRAAFATTAFVVVLGAATFPTAIAVFTARRRRALR